MFPCFCFIIDNAIYISIISIPYEKYLYGSKLGDFANNSPYFRTTKILVTIIISPSYYLNFWRNLLCFYKVSNHFFPYIFWQMLKKVGAWIFAHFPQFKSYMGIFSLSTIHISQCNTSHSPESYMKYENKSHLLKIAE